MPKGPKIVNETESKVSSVCQKALEKLQKKVLEHYQAHPDSAWSGHYLVDLEKTIKAVYQEMGVDIGKEFKNGLSQNMLDFYNKAAKDMVKMGKRNAILGKPDVGLVKQYMESSFEEIAMRTTKMTFEHKRALRSMAADVLRTSSLTGASRKDITKEFLARAQEIPGFKFTDAGGATWNNETYFKMLARTELMNAGRAAYDDKCAKEGVDLVELSTSGHCCDACAEYEGTVFSLTGATPGYPTKQDLIDAGVFHPNCTHSYYAVPNWNLPPPDEEGEKNAEPEEKPEAKPVEKPKAVEKEKPKKPEAKPKQTPEPTKAVSTVPEQVEIAPEQAEIEPEQTPEVISPVKTVSPEPEKKEEPKKAETPSEAVPDAIPEIVEFPENPDELRVVRPAGGSTGAEIVEDENGNRYIRKHGGSAGGESDAHVVNEVNADNAYINAGVNVPPCKIYDTPNGKVKLSKFIENAQRLGDWWRTATSRAKAAMKKKLRKDFAVDVVLGNRDVIGQERDNILIDESGNVWRTDNGAALGFRAQGKRKADWKNGSGADVVTMRTSDFNKEFFGDVDLLDLMKEIAKRDWSNVLDALPEEDRKIVEKRIAIIKQSIPRVQDFKKNSGYLPQNLDEVIRVSMEMIGDGLGERIPTQLVMGNGNASDGEKWIPKVFGWLRSPGYKWTDFTKENRDVSDAIVNAAKTLNFHNAKGGDGQPDKAKLKAAYKLKPELEKLANNGNSGAMYYLHKLEEIKAAEKAGETLNGIMIDDSVDVYTKKPVDNFTSFTAYVNDYISKQSVEYNGRQIPLDMGFIKTAQSEQAGDSYRDEACRVKLVRLSIQGIDWNDAGNEYFTGVNGQTVGWNEAVKYYNNHPDELERDKKAYLNYQASMQVLFENCDFAYNDRKNHVIYLGRTVDDYVAHDAQEGHGLAPDIKQGVNESHSAFQSYKYKGEHLTITEVPISRISGAFMCEREPGSSYSHGCFASDPENEIDADTHGLHVMLAKRYVKNYESLGPYVKQYKEWKKGNYQ